MPDELAFLTTALNGGATVICAPVNTHDPRELELRTDATLRALDGVPDDEAETEARLRGDYEQWVAQGATDFRQVVAQYSELFAALQEANREWRRCVSQGTQYPVEASEHALNWAFRTLFAVFAASADQLHGRCEFFERHRQNCHREASNISRVRKAAADVLKHWRAPVLASQPTFRAANLTSAAVERIRQAFPDSI